MRRQLSPEPHLEHLKKQAKDLLKSHQRGEPEAIARAIDALPAFAGLTHEQAARAPFALHDAQSVIAREYGMKSWGALREEVARRRNVGPYPEALVRSLMGMPLPDEVVEAMKDAWAEGQPADPATTARTLPLVGVRNAYVLPGALFPLHVGRPESLAAIDAALRNDPPTIATFTQRDAAREDVDAASLHPVGCETLIHRRIAEGERAFVVLRGVRWIVLDSLSRSETATYKVARVEPHVVSRADDDSQARALSNALRDRARRLAAPMAEAARALELLDRTTDPFALADLVMANLPCALDAKARYAEARTLEDRLAVAIELADPLLGAAPR